MRRHASWRPWRGFFVPMRPLVKSLLGVRTPEMAILERS